MANEPSPESYVGPGLAHNQPTEVAPQREGVLGWGRDAALDTLRGGLGVIRDVAGVRELGARVAGDPALARSDMDELAKIDYQLRRAKTEAGQYRDEHPEARTFTDKATEFATGILPYAPIAMTGPAQVPIFGALALGHQRVDLRETLRNATPEQLDTIPRYKAMREAGASHQDALDAVYAEGTDPSNPEMWKDVAPSVAGNMLGGGALGLFTKAATRTITSTIVNNVLANVNKTGAAPWFSRRAIGGGAGAVAGGAMGAGGDYTHQATEVTAGLRPNVDYGEVAAEGATQGAIFAGLGAISHRRQPVPAIGTDTVTVARMQAQGYGPPGPVQPSISGRPGAGGTPMEPGDIGRGEYGYEHPSGPSATGGVPIHPGDIGSTEYASTGDWTRPPRGPAPPGGWPQRSPMPTRRGPHPTPPPRLDMEWGDIGPEYGPEGTARTPATGGVAMEPEDIGMSSYATTGTWRRPGGPGSAPPPGGGGPRGGGGGGLRGGGGGRGPAAPSMHREMAEGDIWPSEYGAELPAGTPGRGGVPMEHGDLGTSEYAAGSEWTRPGSARVGARKYPTTAAARRHAPQAMEDRTGTYGYGEEYGREQPVPLGPHERPAREMLTTGEDIYPQERGGETGYGHLIEPPPEEPPPGPRPFPPGGERPSAGKPKKPKKGGGGGDEGSTYVEPEQVGGYPTEEAPVPHPDRGAIRKAVRNIEPTTRGFWSRRIHELMDSGRHPTLDDVIPKMGQRMLGADRDRIANLMRTHPRGVADEFVHGLREIPKHETAGMTAADHTTLQKLKAKGTPEEHEAWAKALESGKKYVWAKMPPSWKRAVKGMERDVSDVVGKNPKVVAEELRRGPEQKFEETKAPYEPVPGREAEAGDIGEYRPDDGEAVSAEAREKFPAIEGEERGKEPSGEGEAKGEGEGGEEEGDTFAQTLDFGRPIEPGEVPYGKAKQRTKIAATLGLTEEGLVQPEYRRRQRRQFGLRPNELLELGPLTEAVRARAAQRLREERFEQRWIDRGNFPAGHALIDGEAVPVTGLGGKEKLGPPTAAEHEQLTKEASDRRIREAQRAVDIQRRTEALRNKYFREALDAVTADFTHAQNAVIELMGGIKLSLDRLPRVQEGAKIVAAAEKERARKASRTVDDYAARDKILEPILRDPALSMAAVDVDELALPYGAHVRTRETVNSLGNMLGDLLHNVGDVPQREGDYPLSHAIEGETAIFNREQTKLMLDRVSPDDIVKVGKSAIQMMAMRVMQGSLAMRELENQLVAETGKKRQISFKVGSRRSGSYPWYDLLTAYKTRASVMAETLKMVERSFNRGEVNTNALGRLKNQILDFYIRERLLSQGRIADLDAHDLRNKSRLYEDMQAEVQRHLNVIAEHENLKNIMTGMAARVNAAGRDTKEGRRLYEQLLEFEKKRYKPKAIEAAKKRLAVIMQETGSIEDMQESTNWSPDHYAEKLTDLLSGMDNRALSAINKREREMLLYFQEQMFGYGSNLPIGARLELERAFKRAGGDEAKIEEARRQAAANSTEARADSELERIRSEGPMRRMTPEQIDTRMGEIDREVTDLTEALQGTDSPWGQVPKMVDTLLYHLRDDKSERVPQSERTLTKLQEELIPQAHARLEALQDEQRKLYELRNPAVVDTTYGLKRALDPAADLTETQTTRVGRRNVTENLNLPFGAYVLPVSDFLHDQRGVLGAQRNIRPRGTMVGKKASFTLRERLANHFFDIVDKVVGDIQVVVLTPEQYRLAREARGLEDDNPAFYDQRTHRIFTDNVTANGPNRAAVLGHEFMHPLTVLAAERFPDIYNRLDRIRRELLREFMQPTSPRWKDNPEVPGILAGHAHALTSTHEFISELFNDDGSVWAALRAVTTPDTLRHELRTNQRGGLVERTLRAIKDGVRRLFMHSSTDKLLNDAVIHSLDLFHSIERLKTDKPMRPKLSEDVHPFTITDAKEHIKEQAEKAKYYFGQRGGISGHFLRWHDINQLGRRAEAGMRAVTAPFEGIVNKVFSTARDILEKSDTPGMLKRLAAMTRLPVERWQEFSDYIDRENYAGLSGEHEIGQGDNQWVSHSDPSHSQMREQHIDLKQRWQALSPEMKAMRNELRDFARKRHGEILKTNVERLVEAKELVPGRDPATEAAVVRHIMDEALPTDDARLQTVPGYGEEGSDFTKYVNEIKSIPQFKKTPGVWYPMMRRGKWVTEGIFKLAKHAKAVNQSAQEKAHGDWEFETESERNDFMRRMAADPQMRDVKLLRAREVKYKTDADGNPLMQDGKMVRAGRREPNAVTRYRAEYNPLLLEFHDSKFKAAKRLEELQAAHDTDTMDLTHVEPIHDPESNYLPPTQSGRALGAMMRGLEHSPGWRNLSDVEQNQLRRDLKEAAIRHTQSVSARASYLPRRYALGADKELLRNFMTYGRNSAFTLAEAKHRNELNDAVKALDKYVEDNKMSRSPGDPPDKYGTLRRQLQAQIKRTLAFRPDDSVAPIWNKGIARILQMSYIDRLVSPSFLLLNASEPWVLGAPLLAGHHGMFKSMREVGRAYKTVAALKLLAKGGSDFGGVVKHAFVGGDHALTDNLQLLRESIRNEPDAADLNKLFDYVDEHGYFDRNAGMELEQIINPEAGWAGRQMDKVDTAFRQVNNQVENINRGVTAIASYRLGRLEGWTHEKSLQHAKDMMHDVNGNYAAHASPEMFRHPWLKPALQFRRYAHRITSNYVRILATVFGRNVKGEDRAVAMKQLAYWTAAQVATSGMLGLPTEPLKATVDALHFAGVINWNWDDVEFHARDAAADMLGPELGMALTRGALRNLGLGLGTRMGYDSLWTYGNLGDKPDAWWAAIGKIALGAPGSWAVDTAEGLRAGVRGLGNWAQGFDSQADADFGEFMQKATQIKAIGDVYKAYSQATGGRLAVTKGGAPLGYDPTGVETVLAGLGVRSSREQEASDYRHEYYTKQKRYNDEKNRLLQAYAIADTDAERGRVMNYAIQQFNPTLPPELKLSVKQLAEAATRRDRQAHQQPEYMGLPINKRTRALLPAPDVYNVN